MHWKSFSWHLMRKILHWTYTSLAGLWSRRWKKLRLLPEGERPLLAPSDRGLARACLRSTQALHAAPVWGLTALVCLPRLWGGKVAAPVPAPNAARCNGVVQEEAFLQAAHQVCGRMRRSSLPNITLPPFQPFPTATAMPAIAVTSLTLNHLYSLVREELG